MNLLRASDNIAVHLVIGAVSVGIGAAAIIPTLAADDSPWQRYWLCIFFATVAVIILVVQLVQCVRSCDGDGDCQFVCVRNFVLYLIFVILITVLCILRL